METTDDLERDDRGYRPEVRFCRTTGAYGSICRECRGEDQGGRLGELFPLANVRVDGVGIAANVRVNGVSAASSVRVNGALAGNISENCVMKLVNEDNSLSGKLYESGNAEVFDDVKYKKDEMVGEPGEKEKSETLQDVQCPATCRSLSREGPGRICGKRCCLSYGHICTHRCDEHWGWNLEKMKVYYTKDMDYIGVFAEVKLETKKVVITVLIDGDVSEDSKKGCR